MATIYDVARRAGVSTYTVSVVLNRSAKVSEELTKRVLEAANDLDYTINRIASSLQTRRTMTIGMLIPDIANPWYGRLVRGVEDILNENKYSLFLGNTRDEAPVQSHYLDVFHSRQVDGVLLFLAPDSEEDLARRSRKRAPMIFVGRRPGNLEADCVSADNSHGLRLATEHLIGRGHRRIALITSSNSLSVSRERIAGWRSALKKAGLPAPPALCREGGGTQEGGRREALALLDAAETPTAFLAGNLPMTTGVLAAIKERKLRVPKDAEVMSSDDSEWLDAFSPPISAVLQPSYEMGVEAARLLLRRIQAPSAPPEHIVLIPELKLR
jgi:DNA-binding LacI/PurR family transcriptional regulator